MSETSLASSFHALVERYWDKEAYEINFNTVKFDKLQKSLDKFVKIMGNNREAETDAQMSRIYSDVDQVIHTVILKEILNTMKIFSSESPVIKIVNSSLERTLVRVKEPKLLVGSLPDELAGYKAKLDQASGKVLTKNVLNKFKCKCFDTMNQLVKKKEEYERNCRTLHDCFDRSNVEIYDLLIGTVDFLLELWAALDRVPGPADKKTRWLQIVSKDKSTNSMKFSHYFVYLIGVMRLIHADQAEASQDGEGAEDCIFGYFETLVDITQNKESKAERFLDCISKSLSRFEKRVKFLKAIRAILILIKYKLMSLSRAQHRDFIKTIYQFRSVSETSLLSPICPEAYELSPALLTEKFINLTKSIEKMRVTISETTKGPNFRYMLRQTVYIMESRMFGIFHVMCNYWLSEWQLFGDPISTRELSMWSPKTLSLVVAELEAMEEYFSHLCRSHSALGSENWQKILENLRTKLETAHNFSVTLNEADQEARKSTPDNKVEEEGATGEGMSRKEIVLGGGHKKRTEEVQHPEAPTDNSVVFEGYMKGDMKDIIRSYRKVHGDGAKEEYNVQIFPHGVPEMERENALRGLEMRLADFLNITSVVFYLVVSFQTSVVLRIFALNEAIMQCMVTKASCLIDYLKRRNNIQDEEIDIKDVEVEKVFVQNLKLLQHWVSACKTNPQGFEAYCFPSNNGKLLLSKALLVAERTLLIYRTHPQYEKRSVEDYKKFSLSDYHMVLKSTNLLLKKTCMTPDTLSNDCKKSLKELNDSLVLADQNKMDYFTSWSDFLAKITQTSRASS